MKRKNLGLWLSVTAVIIAIIAFVIVCCRWITFPESTESFIGILVSLLAICVTFVIGYQIINTLNIKESVKEIDHKTAEVTQELKDLNKFKDEIKAINARSIGDMYSHLQDYNNAICYYVDGLNYALKSDDARRSDAILSNIETALNNWEHGYNEHKESSTFNGFKSNEIIDRQFYTIHKECVGYLLYAAFENRIKDCEKRCKERY